MIEHIVHLQNIAISKPYSNKDFVDISLNMKLKCFPSIYKVLAPNFSKIIWQNAFHWCSWNIYIQICFMTSFLQIFRYDRQLGIFYIHKNIDIIIHGNAFVKSVSSTGDMSW